MTSSLPLVQCCAPLAEEEARQLEAVVNALADRHRVTIDPQPPHRRRRRREARLLRLLQPRAGCAGAGLRAARRHAVTLRHRDFKDEPARPFHPVADLDRDRGWIPEGEAPETDPFGI